VSHKPAVKLLQGEYLADELKGIIGSCDMFLGCHLHPTIASTSMGIPTTVIASSDKYHRLIGKTMGQKAYIVDTRNCPPHELLTQIKARIDSLWANREAIKQELEKRAKMAKEQAWSYGKLIEELAQSSKKASAS
ncbi:unnamed protein product, partial [marine sediment metagenome]